MALSNQINAGMIISINHKLFRVESSIKVTVPKGTPFIKMKLRDLSSNKILEKNFKINQHIDDVALIDRPISYLYMEGKDYLFLDTKNLDQVLVSGAIVGEAIHFLKEGVELKASYYGDTVFAVELPQFLEIMVAKIEGGDENPVLSGGSKMAILETGAKIEVPPFIEVGDIIKVDTKTGEYIQRV